MNKIENVLIFSNFRIASLYLMELEGQISDGKYENTRPHDHWEWLWHNEVRMVNGDQKPGYYTTHYYENRLKTYNLDEWPCWIANKKGKYNDYEWAKRVLAYGKFGKILDSMNFTDIRTLDKESGNIELMLETIQSFLDSNENGTYKEFIEFAAKNFEWRMEYIAKVTLIDENMFEVFKNTEYDIKELRKDIKQLKVEVNDKHWVKDVDTLEIR